MTMTATGAMLIANKTKRTKYCVQIMNAGKGTTNQEGTWPVINANKFLGNLLVILETDKM